MDEENTPDKSDDPIINKMLKRFDLSLQAESDNRKRFLLAKKFALGGEYQWDPEIYDLRGTDNLPRDSYNQIPQFTHQVTNDARMNSTQTRFIPAKDADIETAEIREDLARNIQSGSDADVAYDTAIENTVEGGWGYWRYLTEYENDDTFDQIIKLGWVPNPLVIYDDPNTIRQDRLDREYLIQVCDEPIDAFNSAYGRDYAKTELNGIGDKAPEWKTSETVRVAEYWSVEKKKTKLYRLKAKGDKSAGEPIKELPKGANKEDYETREVIEPKVIWRKCTALEVLETRDWPGKYIPYVFVAGEEKLVDGKRILTGLVEHMMAPQKAFNYQSNSVIHMTALAPKSPWIAPIRAIKGLEEYWDKSNIRNYAYLPFNDLDDSGQPIQPPERTPAGTDIAAGVALIQQAQQNFYNVTGIYPASLGARSNETSGKAINARKVEGDISTFHYVDNINRGKIAGGLIMNDLITNVYDGSRLVTTQKEDKEIRKVKINQKYKNDKGEMKEHDMTLGTYEVMITTGPSYTTMRQESADTLLSLAQSTNLMEVAPDIVYGTMDFPGAEKVAERYKKTLPPELTQDDDDQAEIPPQVVQQMQQMQQVIEQLQQALQAADQEVQSKQAELQLKAQDIQSKQGDMELKAQKQQMDELDAQRKHELDMAQLQISADELQLKREEMALTQQKIELEAVKIQLDYQAKASQPQGTKTDSKQEAPSFGKEALMAQIQTLEAQEGQKMQESQMMMEQEQIRQEEERMRSDVLFKSLAGIQENLSALTQSITAPKQVIRDPATGLIQAVINTNEVIN